VSYEFDDLNKLNPFEISGTFGIVSDNSDL
jgi:hypothetical protein